VTSKQRLSILIGSISGIIAVVSALPIFELCLDSIGICEALIVIAFPGMLLSMGASGNVHVFSPWLVMLFNWIFYALVLIVLRKVIGIFRGN